MKPRCPFTLIELLTVIAIIAILSGILLPAIGSAKQKAKNTQAKAQIKALQLAIQSYTSEYGYMPTAGSGDLLLSDAQYTALIGDLSCTNSRKNPRGIVFLEAQSTTATYNDPWGRRFSVVLDLDYNNQIALHATNGPWQDVLQTVAAWSWGPNGVNNLGRGPSQGSSNDDIASWGD
jgi:prepilin-type N-terminal cleavage/methylation domain-containing protein